MKTGLFVGSFNPPTKAHFNIGHYLYQQHYLDKIVYLPVNSNKKQLVNLTDRLNMVRNYTNKYSYFEVDDIMLDYKEFNYLIIDKLKNKYSNLYLIMGSDLLINLKDFINYKTILEQYNFLIIPRFNIDSENIINRYYKKYVKKIKIINITSDISSNKVRECFKNNLDASDLVMDEVLEYIDNNRLYKDE